MTLPNKREEPGPIDSSFLKNEIPPANPPYQDTEGEIPKADSSKHIWKSQKTQWG